MDQVELIKLATEAIKELQSKNFKLEEDYNKLASAVDLVFDMVNRGVIPVEDISSAFNDIKSKNISELNMMKTASQYVRDNLSTFSVSNKYESNEEVTDLVSFLLEQ